MPIRDLPARPDLDQYKTQAKELLRAARTGDAAALDRVRAQAPARRGRGAGPAAPLKLADAQLAIAREHGFDSWPKFAARIAVLNGREERAAIRRAAEAAVVSADVATLERLLRDHGSMFSNDRESPTGRATEIIARSHSFKTWDEFSAFKALLSDPASPVARFESAVEAVIDGDEATLDRLLREDPDLVRARSVRSHHSTLLHYVGANGVEGFRQRTPKNAVRIAEMLIRAGADVDATAEMYGGGSTTLGLIATSIHPKVAGVQLALIDTMLAHGASIEGRAGRGSAVNGCLANGRREAAEYLANRGAPLDLEGAAGVGRLDLVTSYFNADGALKPTATEKQMKDGLAWACEYGRTEVVEFLYDRGIPLGERLVPHGETGLHWAAYCGHVDTVSTLLTRGAPLEIKDRSFDGTPLGWAVQGWRDRVDAPEEPYCEVIVRLVAAGARVDRNWLADEQVQDHPKLLAALRGERPAP